MLRLDREPAATQRLLRILNLPSNSHVSKNHHLKFLLEANILFSNREAKAVGPAIWMDLEPTKKGILLNFSDSIPEASQVDCVGKAWCRSCLPARLLQSICLLNALLLCLQNGEHQLNFFAVGTKGQESSRVQLWHWASVQILVVQRVDGI